MSRRYHIGLPVLIYVGLAVLVGVAAANRPNNLLVWIFGLTVAGLLASGVVSGLMMLGVRVARLDPRSGRVGEPLSVRYAVTNRSRLLPIFNLHLEELPSDAPDDWARFAPGTRPWQGDAWVMQVGPGETVHAETVLWPQRRGRVRFGAVRAWSSFPFGLMRKSVTFRKEQHALIFPRLLHLRPEILRAVTPGGAGGLRLSRQAGQGEDYFGMREYKPGDSLRQIAWKRTATLDSPITVERTRPSPPRLRVVLNLQRPTDQLRTDPREGFSPRDLEERAISLAASFISMAERHGYEVGLTILGLPERPTPLRRGHWHVQKLMGTLAALELDQPRQAAPAPGAPDAERAGLLVISPDRTDPAIGAPAGGLREGVLHVTARQLDALCAAVPASGASDAAPTPAGSAGAPATARPEAAA